MKPAQISKLDPRAVGAVTLAAIILHQSGCQSEAYQAIMAKAKPMAPVFTGVGTAILVKANKNSAGEAIAAGIVAGVLTKLVITEISAAQERQAQRRLKEREADLAAQRERYLKAEKEGRSEPRFAAIEVAPEPESKTAAAKTPPVTPASKPPASTSIPASTGTTNSPGSTASSASTQSASADSASNPTTALTNVGNPTPAPTNTTSTPVSTASTASTETTSPDSASKPTTAPATAGDSTPASTTASSSTPAAGAGPGPAQKRQSFVIYDLKNAQFVGTSVVEVRRDTPLADAAVLSIKGEDEKKTDAVVYAMR